MAGSAYYGNWRSLSSDLTILQHAAAAMQFVLILAVLAALAVSDYAPEGPVEGAGVLLGLALGTMLMPVAWAAVISRITARRVRESECRARVLRAFSRLRLLHCVL